MNDDYVDPVATWVEDQLRENGWKPEDYPLNRYGERVIPLVRGTATSHDAEHEKPGTAP